MSARYFMRHVLPPVVPAIAVTLTAELAVRQGWVPSFLIPAPSQVVASLLRDWPELWGATLDTADASLIGFAISIAIGAVGTASLLSVCGVFSDCANYCHRAAAGHLVRLGSHGGCVGLHRVDLSNYCKHLNGLAVHGSSSARSVSTL